MGTECCCGSEEQSYGFLLIPKLATGDQTHYAGLPSGLITIVVMPLFVLILCRLMLQHFDVKCCKQIACCCELSVTKIHCRKTFAIYWK